MTDLSDRIGSLPPEKRALFDLRLARLNPALSRLQSISRRSHPEDPAPLTYEQERLWFVQQVFPQGAAYNVSNAFRFEGEIHPGALAASLGEVVRRHEILRSAYMREGERLVQVVRPSSPFFLPLVVLDALPAATSWNEARRLLRVRSSEPFDLASGRPIRTLLVRLNSQSFHLLATIHHIATDWWSFAIFRNELVAIYAAILEGRRPSTPEPPVQFADFALWQRRWLDSERLETEAGFWRERLAGAPQSVDLPTDRRRPPEASFRGARHSFDLDSDLSFRLHGLARRRGATPFAVHCAALAALVFRWAQVEDLLIGTPVADRNRPEVEHLIGYFLNLLVLRVAAGADPTFDEVLEATRRSAHAAFEHQDFPFGKLLEVLRPERSLDRSPLFQVSFVYVTAPETPAALASLTESRLGGVALDPGTARVDLTYVAEDSPRGFTCFFEYSTDLFDAPTLRRLEHGLRALLETFADQPERKVSSVSLLSAAERQAVLGEWSDAPEAVSWRDVTSLFAARAEEQPDAIALVCGEAQMTFAELARRAAAIARDLRERGLRPEDRVAIALPRSPLLIAALLGVLEAGGAYVPLELGHPARRLAGMIEDAGVAFLLATGQARAALPREALEGVLWIDPGSCHPGRPTEIGVRREPSEDLGARLAYVLFTSGSTGRPKGVEITHRGLSSLLSAMADDLRFETGRAFLAATSIGFDIAALEIFLPLCCGGRLELAGGGEVGDGPALYRRLEEVRPDHFQATPSGFRLLLEAGWRGAPGLSALAGGEVLPPSLAGEIARRTGALRNGYGPTEATIYATVDRVMDGAGPTIGRPLAAGSALIFDRRLEPAPIGVPGDLYLAGVRLARGYAGSADLTAERFVPQPSAAEPGRRLYRTGDLARWLPDGRIEFLGRRDHQVKVRGVRIELGELEAVLDDLEQIRAAAVLLGKSPAGEPQLIAFVAPRQGAHPTPADLRAALGDRLPAGMSPRRFHLMAALPKTTGGKIDRAALARLDLSRAEGEVRSEAPLSAVEALVAEAWRDSLGLDRVSVGENFFELGGDSMTSLRLAFKLRERGIEIEPRQLFRHPTIRELAEEIEGKPKRSAAALGDGAWLEERLSAFRAAFFVDLPALSGTALEDLYPATPTQEEILAECRLAPLSAYYLYQWHGLVDGPFDVVRLRAAWTAAVARHSGLRTAFFAGAEVAQGVFHAPDVEVGLLDLGGIDPGTQAGHWATLLEEDRERGFDLSRAPLARWTVVRLASDRWRILWTFHHLALDGWSVQRLLGEIFGLYRGAPSAGPSAPLMRAYVAWLYERLWREPEAAREHWQKALSGWQGTTFIARPAGGTEPASADSPAESRREVLEVSAEVTADLVEAARRLRVTLSTLVQVAWGLVLAKATGESDVLFGATVSGRPADLLGAGEIVGMLINAVPVRLRFDPAESASRLIERVQAEQTEARRFDYLPLRQALKCAGAAAVRRPLFDTVLTFENLREDGVLREQAGDPAELRFREVGMVRRVGRQVGLIVTPGRRLALELHHDRRALPSPAAAGLLADLEAALRLVAANPEAPAADWLTDFAGVTPRERELSESRPKPAPGSLPETLDPRPESNTERLLAEVWQVGLGVGEISSADDFFALGGDSILALRIANLARRRGLAFEPRLLFQHPTLRGLAAALDTAMPESDAGPAGNESLAAFRDRLLGRLGSRAAALEDVLPPTPMQQELYSEAMLLGGAGLYVFQWHCDLGGVAHAAKLRAAWAETVARHPGLRTAFAVEPELAQAVHRTVEISWREIDVRALDAADRERSWHRLLEADRVEDFDPTRPPLLRWRIVRVGDDRIRLLWTFHHLALDGWSVPIVLAEVFRRYRAAPGAPAIGRRPPPSIRDYAAWRVEQDPAAAERYWRAELADWAGSSLLAASESEGVGSSTEPDLGSEILWLLAERTAALGEHARGRHLTLNTLVQAAWGLILGQRTARTDVLFAAIVSGRPAEIEGGDQIVGMLVNAVPVRFRLDGGGTLDGLLARLQEQQAMARRFEYAPLRSALSSVATGAAPLFDTLLTFENQREDELRRELAGDRGDLEIGAVGMSGRSGSQVNLVVGVGRRLSLRLHFDRRTMSQSLALSVLSDLDLVLGRIAQGGDLQVSDLVADLERAFAGRVRETFRTHRLRRER